MPLTEGQRVNFLIDTIEHALPTMAETNIEFWWDREDWRIIYEALKEKYHAKGAGRPGEGVGGEGQA